MLNERDIIAAIARRAQGMSPLLRQGIGDDCAVIDGPGDSVWLLSTDTLIEGVHFDLKWHPPRLLGHKAVNVNLSDIAAMGGEPRFLLLALALPDDLADSCREELLNGIHEACQEAGCLLAGGDTVRSPAGLSLTLTVIGQQPAAEVIHRRTARIGDLIWVSGPLGSAAAGLALCRNGLCSDAAYSPLIAAHLDPRPRCRLGREIARRRLAHAMQDISDGIATDLAHICTASNAGAVLDEALLPRHPLLQEAAVLCGSDPLELILAGGEDYELLWTASPESTPALLALAAECSAGSCQVGRICARPGVWLKHPAPPEGLSQEQNVSYRGYDHFSQGT